MPIATTIDPGLSSCPSCQAGALRISRTRSLPERMLRSTLKVRPFRCYRCGGRFWRGSDHVHLDAAPGIPGRPVEARDIAERRDRARRSAVLFMLAVTLGLAVGVLVAC